MTKRATPDLVEFAKSAAVDATDAASVGDYLETLDEGDSTFTFLFSAKLKGYQGWRWSVTLFAPSKQDPTISEVLLLPGEDSLLAPAWVPWAERLADWKALQAELEAQAAAEAAELAEAEGADESGDDELDDEEADASDDAEDPDFEVLDDEETTLEDEEESALADSEQSVDSEQDSDDAGPRPPRFGRRNRRRKNDKNRKN